MTTTAPIASRPWSPTDRDRLIYRWVKFDGHKQTWVADQLGLNQSTVSRIVDRYERWIARGGAAQHGAPSRDERLRAQRWLTYERNEWILASCMRLSGEMERSLDTSKSTILHHSSEPSRELEVRTEHKTLERSGTACRFLRLAHRVNMDQEKLLEKIDLPALEPLTLDVNELSQATADAREGSQLGSPFEKVVLSRREGQAADNVFNSAVSQTTSDAPETQTRSASEGIPLFTPATSEAASEPPPPNPASLSPSVAQSPDITTQSAAPEPTHSALPAPHSELSLHTPATTASLLTPASPTTSVENAPAKNKTPPAYPVVSQPPETADSLAEILNTPRPNSPPPILLSMPFHLPLTT